VDEERLSWLRVGECQLDRYGTDSSRGAIDELQFAVVEIEDFGGVGAVGRSVGRLIVESDCRTGGVPIWVDRHGVEEIIHDESHFFSIRRVDRAILCASGD